MLKNHSYITQCFADTVLIDACTLRRDVYKDGSEAKKRNFQIILKMQEYSKKQFSMDAIKDHSDTELEDRINIYQAALQRNAANEQNSIILRENLKHLQNERSSRNQNATHIAINTQN